MNLPSSELERVLHKSAEEISAYDNELANYVVDRIDESLTRTNAYAHAYEVMEGTAKHVVDIYNEKYPPHRRHEKGVLYTMLPHAECDYERRQLLLNPEAAADSEIEHLIRVHAKRHLHV